VIGGGARGLPWMQIIADVTGRKVETVADPLEAGAIGIALTAAVGLGIYPDFESLKKIVHVEREFVPQTSNSETYNTLYKGYKGLYTSLRGLYREINEERLSK
jgi:xylulokinase